MKRVLSILVVLMLVFALIACGETAEEPAEPAEGEEEQEREEEQEEPGAKKDWIIALETDIVQFDPIKIGDATTSGVAFQMYERLLTRTPDGQPTTCLAEDWETSEDGLSWTFYLREGVTFHDGSPFNAEVVEWHFTRAQSDESNFQAQFSVIDEIEVHDEYTVTFHLGEPMAAFADNVIMPNGGFIPSMEAFNSMDYEDWSMQPIGTGPFMWSEWVQGQRVELVRNPEWWGDGPKLEKVVYRVIPEANTQVIELETGGVDLITRASPQDLERFEENPDLNVIVTPAYRGRELKLNVTRFPFDDKRIREAVNWAVDMPAIVEAVAQPLTVPSDSILPMAGWGYAGEGVLPNFGHDPDKARELIEEAGFTMVGDYYEKDGQRLSVTIHSPDHRYFMDKDICEVVRHEFEKVGIETEVKVMEWGAFLDEVRAGEFQMTFLGWNQSGADPSLFTDALVMTGGRGNYAGYSDPELDDILRRAGQEVDIEVRKELYKEAQMIINENAWHIYVGNEALIWVHPSNVRGWDPSPALSGDYTQLYFE
ncbi:MAG: ABC transporter substrate-binding protein [Bacillota bacterium]